MEVSDALRHRRMVRSFLDRPVDADALDAVLHAARRAPSAGNSQGVDLVVLEGAEQTARYWDVTLPPPRRASFGWPGLLRAPVLIVVVADAARYVQRYAEPDKAATGLGAGEAAWGVPYWHVDAGMAVMALLLRAVDVGLGALFFGIFDHAPAVAAALGIPHDRSLVGTIALGHPDVGAEQVGRSADRPRRGDAVHRGAW